MSKISIIGVPMDLGADRRGVDMGPSALRYADLNERLTELGNDVQDLGDIGVLIPETQHFGDPHAKYLDEIANACTHLAKMVLHVHEEAGMRVDPIDFGDRPRKGLRFIAIVLRGEGMVGKRGPTNSGQDHNKAGSDKETIFGVHGYFPAPT